MWEKISAKYYFQKQKATVHEGEKPFACDICGQCFAEKQNMKMHLDTSFWRKAIPM
jgi:uncharacterized Zn-finger protein